MSEDKDLLTRILEAARHAHEAMIRTGQGVHGAWAADALGTTPERARFAAALGGGTSMSAPDQTIAGRIAGTEPKAGEAWARLAEALSNFIPGGPMSGRKAPVAAQPQAVYHGSPHRFRKFRMSRVGTGEGAQAYGHGLYFAESPSVARGYARGLSTPKINDRTVNYDDPREVAAMEVYLKQGDIAKAADSLYRAGKQRVHSARPSVAIQASQILDDILDKKLPNRLPQISHGNTYTAHIPDKAIETFLDWDKPWSEQSPEVRKRVETAVPETRQARIFGLTGSQRFNGQPTGQDVYNRIISMRWSGESSPIPSNANASQYAQFRASRWLSSLGVPGIRYLDAMSRGEGEGTHNYVVFDENLVRATHRNDVPLTRGGIYAQRWRKRRAQAQP